MTFIYPTYCDCWWVLLNKCSCICLRGAASDAWGSGYILHIIVHPVLLLIHNEYPEN